MRSSAFASNSALDAQAAASYLLLRHGRNFSADQLRSYEQDRAVSGLPWGPIPISEGHYTPEALDAFADQIKAALERVHAS